MSAYTIPADVDPSDVFDTEREWEIPNVDVPAPPIPGTTSVHPVRCRCLSCQADAEMRAYLARSFRENGLTEYDQETPS